MYGLNRIYINMPPSLKDLLYWAAATPQSPEARQYVEDRRHVAMQIVQRWRKEYLSDIDEAIKELVECKNVLLEQVK